MAELVFLGLDCGGSTCRALAIDQAGATLFAGQAGAASLSSTPPALLQAHLERAVKDAPPPHAVSGCFAGLLTSEDKARAERLLQSLFPAAVVRAEPDYAAAYFAADPVPDVCIVAGTGSQVCSYLEGRWVTSGGGGYLLGDAGSAYDIGRRGLRHWLAQQDEASPALDEAIQATFHTLIPSEVVANLYAQASPAARLGRLAQAVTKDATAGKRYARTALQASLEELAAVTVGHVHKYFPDKELVRIGLAGGVWRNSPLVLELFDAILMKGLHSGYVLERGRRAPVFGAAELAKELMLGN